MNGIVNKIIGVVLCMGLVLLMLCNVMVATELHARRSIVAEATNFLDKVTDTGYLDEKQLQDLYLGINGYGPVCDVEVTRFARVIEPDPKRPGQTYITYMVTDNIFLWNQGDLCKVKVVETGYTALSYFIYSVLGMSLEPVEFAFTGRIR